MKGGGANVWEKRYQLPRMHSNVFFCLNNVKLLQGIIKTKKQKNGFDFRLFSRPEKNTI